MNVFPYALYAVALLLYAWHFARRQGVIGRVATTVLVAASLAHTFVIGMQTMKIGHVPFAGTKAERERAHDPRQSIEERYPTRERYLELVQDVGAALVKDRYLLPDDVPGLVEHAGEHWDLLLNRPVGATK